MEAESLPRWGTCRLPDCKRPVVREPRCVECRKAFCALHQRAPYHSCTPRREDIPRLLQAASEAEILDMEQRINFQALLFDCRLLYYQQSCRVLYQEHGYLRLGGRFYFEAHILFQDGNKWVAEIPRLGHGEGDLWKSFVMVLSEFATLQYLQSTTIPAPRVYGYGLAPHMGNRVGVPYLLRQYVRGVRYNHALASEEGRYKVIRQMAYATFTLSRHSFATCGSLFPREDTDVRVQEIKRGLRAMRCEINLVPETHDARLYYQGMAQQYMDLIADGQLHPRYPSQAFTFYQLFKNDPDVLWKDADENNPAREEAPLEEGFYLKNVNDDGSHILIDQFYNITGIIDWQFSRTVPASEAFGPSLFVSDHMSGDEPLAHLTHTYLGRVLETSCRPILARYLRSGDTVRRFYQGLLNVYTKTEISDQVVAATHRIVQRIRPNGIRDLEAIRMWLEMTRTLGQGSEWRRVEAFINDLHAAGALWQH